MNIRGPLEIVKTIAQLEGPVVLDAGMVWYNLRMVGNPCTICAVRCLEDAEFIVSCVNRVLEDNSFNSQEDVENAQ